MNAKKAKALRKILRNLEKVNPEKITSVHGFLEDTKKRTLTSVEDLDDKGELIERKVPTSVGQISVDPRSRRGVYLHIKKTLEGSL